MNKKLFLLVGEAIFFILLLMVVSIKTQASVMDGPNLGKYIYEEHEVLTQGQYSKVNDINDQLQTGKTPQRLYIVILDNDPEKPDGSDNMYKYLGIKSDDYYASNILQKWQDQDEKQSGDYGRASDDDFRDNMLVLYRNQGRIGFVGNSQNYITDYKLWKITFGKMHGIKSNNQIDSFMNISNSLVKPILYSVNVENASSSQWRDVEGEFIAGIIIAGVIFAILFLLLLFASNPAGADYSPDSYDNGFYDGSTFSNYQNNDRK
ncbi:hypothetical protein [Companilactobacillus insicii]|uniref:hypothetical protein n=1 Tax=Companilactobacillus insicii TaxID=1732567 RepID=UPI000F7AD462|nr:hypothetical protein [Companilactobacillus insicii]